MTAFLCVLALFFTVSNGYNFCKTKEPEDEGQIKILEVYSPTEDASDPNEKALEDPRIIARKTHHVLQSIAQSLLELLRRQTSLI